MLQEHLDYKLLKMCADCGACYDVCPSCLHLDGYDPRAVIKDILAGDYEKWLTEDSIWQCLECHECLEMCYQHYGFENAMSAMRKLAIKTGNNPPQVKRGFDMFIKSSRLGEPAMPARKKLGLPAPAEAGTDEFLKMLEAYKASRGIVSKEESTGEEK